MAENRQNLKGQSLKFCLFLCSWKFLFHQKISLDREPMKSLDSNSTKWPPSWLHPHKQLCCFYLSLSSGQRRPIKKIYLDHRSVATVTRSCAEISVCSGKPWIQNSILLSHWSTVGSMTWWWKMCVLYIHLQYLHLIPVWLFQLIPFLSCPVFITIYTEKQVLNTQLSDCTLDCFFVFFAKETGKTMARRRLNQWSRIIFSHFFPGIKLEQEFQPGLLTCSIPDSFWMGTSQ